MAKATNPLEFLRDLFRKRADEIAREVARQQAFHGHQVEQLQRLEGYSAEYRNRRFEDLQQGVSQLLDRNQRAFMDNLDRTIAAQRGLVDRAAHDVERVRARWMEALRRAKSLETLSERALHREMEAELRREQKTLDEVAGRRVESRE